jgi:putative restriction endonuclease
MAVGEIPGVAVGAHFANRRALYEAGVHRDVRRGICGSATQLGAESIVLSAGYEDDEDFGDLVYYTGQGGRDTSTGLQVSDQAMAGPNRSLSLNAETTAPVRVVRRVVGGFRYDGLYRVEDAWISPGRRGFLICRYRLRRLGGAHVSDGSTTPAQRQMTTHYRLLRQGAVPMAVKAMYDFTCQVCGTRLETAAGPYAEGAHVLPLGAGYDGPDVVGNVLCLCPNDHVRLDHGAIFIDDNFKVIARDGRVLGLLRLQPEHRLDLDCIRAHRAIFDRA